MRTKRKGSKEQRANKEYFILLLILAYSCRVDGHYKKEFCVVYKKGLFRHSYIELLESIKEQK